MSENTPIEWTDDSWNPVRARNKETGGIGHFCVKVSPGCRHCYAEKFQPRVKNHIRYAAQDLEKVAIFFDHEVAERPLRRKRPRRIFPCSMTDLFGEFVPDDMIALAFAYMAYARQHTFQVTTKRPERALELVTSEAFAERYDGACTMVADIACEILGRRGEFDPNARRRDDIRALDPAFPLANVWLGASVEDQQRADERRGAMERLALERWVTWVSNEPALGPVDWAGWEFLSWMVSGGESGKEASPTHPDWHRADRDWCAKNHVAYFFKQWGAHLPGEMNRGDVSIAWQDGRREWYGDHQDIKYQPYWLDSEAGRLVIAYPVGKKKAGRLLDGRTHDGYPQ